MEKITERQQQILDFLRGFLASTGAPPSVRQIARHFRFSSAGTVHDHLSSLRRKGYLESLEGHRRGFRWSSLQPCAVIPEVGRVRAGEPAWAEEDVGSYVSVDRDWARGAESLFALRVAGDSMRDAGIREGDRVVVRRQKTAENGDIVVALKGDETTVKYFRRRGNDLFLEPAHPHYSAFPARDFTIIGKVVGLTRSY